MINSTNALPLIPPPGSQTVDRLPAIQDVDPADVELLACVLDGGRGRPETKDIAARLLRGSSFEALTCIDLTPFRAAQMLTPTQLHRLELCQRLWRRWKHLEEPSTPPRIRSDQDAYAVLAPHLTGLSHEEMRVLILNTQYELIAHVRLAVGTIDSCAVRIAEIVREALLRNAPMLLIAHNHPSGDPTPSPEDITMTTALLKACSHLDLMLLNHLILGAPPRYSSLKRDLEWI